MTSPWVNLTITLRGLEEPHRDEVIGGLAELTQALGASETLSADLATTWKLSFCSNVNRQEIEEITQNFLLPELNDVLGSVGATWEWEEQPDENWAVAYREYFHPVEISPNFRIVAPWHGAKADGRIMIVINPGQGFGTGTHETTQLCLEALAQHVQSGSQVLDVGSGSGILSIAAVKLGAGLVTAIEMDAAANSNAKENYELNALSGKINLLESNAEDLPEQEFDIVVCNMLLTNAVKLFPALPNRVKGNGVLILAGFLTRESDDAKILFPSANGVFISCAEKGEWGSWVWRKNERA